MNIDYKSLVIGSISIGFAIPMGYISQTPELSLSEERLYSFMCVVSLTLGILNIIVAVIYPECPKVVMENQRS